MLLKARTDFASNVIKEDMCRNIAKKTEAADKIVKTK